MIVGERDGVSLVKDMGSEMLYRLQLTSMSLDKWTRKRHHSPGHKRRYWWCQDDVRETGIVSVSIVSAWWRRDQVGGPVASKLDCHRDKNLLLGDFYHSQLWWTLACCHQRSTTKIEDEEGEKRRQLDMDLLEMECERLNMQSWGQYLNIEKGI